MFKVLKIILLGAGMSAIYSPQIMKDEVIEEEPTSDEDGGEEEVDLISVTDEDEPVYTASVVLGKYSHGKVSVDILEGNEGDICTVTANAGLLYKVDYVSVNGVNLIESEDTSGQYTFALVSGENIIDANFIVDEELCAEMSDIVREAGDKDWENLFSLNNVFTLIKWVLDGGLLIMIARYFIKDKKLEKKVEDAVKETVNNVIPENTQKVILTTLENTINPLLNKILSDSEEMKEALKTLSKCMALAQENTPESRLAIIDELSKIKIGDTAINEKVKKFIDESTLKIKEEFQNALDSLNNISENNKKILDEIPLDAEENKKKVF